MRDRKDQENQIERLGKMKRRIRLALMTRNAIDELSVTIDRSFDNLAQIAYFEGYKDCLKYEVKR